MIQSASFTIHFKLYFSFFRHRSFKGSTVGKAAVMAMCGRKSGGVVQVRQNMYDLLCFLNVLAVFINYSMDVSFKSVMPS